MENYKIRVENEAEIKEAQELFIELGYKEPPLGYFNGPYVKSIQAWDDMALTWSDDHHRVSSEFNEITFPKLRDLVVLKRNDVGDATHISKDGTCHYYSSSESELYFYLNNNGWYATNTRYNNLKPMKEYLRKNSNGTYSYVGTVHPDHVHDLFIEIPKGSETFNYYDRKDNLFFLKGTGENALFSNDLNDWAWQYWGDIGFDGVVCLWSRHTHPEDLPFVDDEPSLNNQYAEIEQVRQASIADTLRERQSTYGDFKDVANTTQYLLQMLSTDAMSDVQLEALHMICSKLSRIAHGDPNHKDSWLDIAGYATLVERSL